MTHASLFSGIGGFDLAAEWMGWENKFHCEWNEFGQKILKHYWPQSELFTDITKSDFTKYANTIDVLTGGFPCQPYSGAGKRLGKEDERHLWPQMLRAIREIAPRYVVGENVRGLTNWNGGMVFDEVCTDLENLGYQVAPFLIPACAVNAPHRRERIWFVAYCHSASTEYKISARGNLLASQSSNGYATDTNCDGRDQCDCKDEKLASEGRQYAQRDTITNDERGHATYTAGWRMEGHRASYERHNSITNELNAHNSERQPRMDWQKFPTQPAICSGDDGLSLQLDGITFPKWRKESIKAYGNAVVPQVVYQIFKAIQQHELQ